MRWDDDVIKFPIFHNINEMDAKVMMLNNGDSIIHNGDDVISLHKVIFNN